MRQLDNVLKHCVAIAQYRKRCNFKYELTILIFGGHIPHTPVS